MADDLSAGPARILDAIRRLIDAHGWPPTIREIAAEAGLHSPSTVYVHLLELEAQGLIVRGLLPRQIRVVE